MSVLHDVKLMHINFSCNFQAISRVAGEARSLLSIGYECCRLETQLRPEATSFAELLKAQMQKPTGRPTNRARHSGMGYKWGTSNHIKFYNK